MGGYAAVSPQPLPGWTEITEKREDGTDYQVFCRGRKVVRYGAEEVSIDLCELMALVEILEEAPMAPLVIYTDASYVCKGFAAPPRSQRRATRRSNRGLWNRLTEARAKRESAGHAVLLRKCRSHGKDESQNPIVTRWNSLADKMAGLLAKEPGDGVNEWWPEGEDGFALLYRGMTVRGDPRKFIGATMSTHMVGAWKELKCGFLPELIATRQLNPAPLRSFRSPRLLARDGLLRLAGFCAQLQTLALPAPYEHRHSRDPKFLEFYCPRDENDNMLCPACGQLRPDTWHMAGICPSGDPLRSSARCVGTALLSGLLPPTVPPKDIPAALGEWLLRSIGATGLSISKVSDPPRSLDGAVHLHSTLSMTKDRVKRYSTKWARKNPYSFVLCTATGLKHIMESNKRTLVRTVLCIPANRFPMESNLPHEWSHESIVLCRVVKRAKCDHTSRRLPTISEDNLRKLAKLLQSSVLFGAWGMYLYWNGHPYQLDTIPLPEFEELIDECELLPDLRGTTCRPPSDRWVPDWSWLGLWPNRLSEKLKGLLGHWPIKVRVLARKNLTLTAVLAQREIWKLYLAVTQHVLRRERDIKTRDASEATTRSSEPSSEPPRALPAAGAVFPPSRRDINSVARVKGLLSKVTSLNEQLFTDAAVRAEVSVNTRTAIWPMVLTTQDLSAGATIPASSGPIALTAVPEEAPPPAPPMSRFDMLKENQRRRILREAGLPEDYLEQGPSPSTTGQGPDPTPALPLPPVKGPPNSPPRETAPSGGERLNEATLPQGAPSTPKGARTVQRRPRTSAIGKLWSAWASRGKAQKAPEPSASCPSAKKPVVPLAQKPGSVSDKRNKGPKEPHAGKESMPPCGSGTIAPKQGTETTQISGRTSPPVWGPPRLSWQRDPLTAEERTSADNHINGVDMALASGCPLGQDLVDRCLDTYTSRLRRVSRRTGLCPLSNSDEMRVGVITSFQSGALIDGSRWTQDSTVRTKHRVMAQQKALRTIASHDITLMPCVLRNHWVGLVFHCPPNGRRGRRSVRLYLINSIEGYGEDEVSEAVRQLFDCPAAGKYGFDVDTGDNCLLLRVDTRQQGQNNSDCGVLMLHTMFSMLAEADLLTVPLEPTWDFLDLRRWLALLLMGFWPPSQIATSNGGEGETPPTTAPCDGPDDGGVSRTLEASLPGPTDRVIGVGRQSEGPGPPGKGPGSSSSDQSESSSAYEDAAVSAPGGTPGADPATIRSTITGS